MLTTKQLEHALRVAYWADDDEGQDFLQAEISRRTHGPFTLVEVVASGYIRRPCWPDGCYATSIRPCLDKEGLEFSDGRGLFPVGLLDLTAVDYEAKPIDNTEETKESKKP